MWPVKTVQTLVISPRGRCMYLDEFGVLEPGGDSACFVVASKSGQVMLLSSAEWIWMRTHNPSTPTFSLWDSAFHEAGHAIVGTALGKKVESISLVPAVEGEGWSMSRVIFQKTPLPDDIGKAALVEAAARLGGRAADARSRRASRPGGERDLEEVRDLARQLLARSARKRREFVRISEAVAAEVIEAAWPAVRQLACLLMHRAEVGESEMGEVMATLSEPRRRRLVNLEANLG